MGKTYNIYTDEPEKALKDIKKKRKIIKTKEEQGKLQVTFKERTWLTDGTRLSPYIDWCSSDEDYTDSGEDETWADILNSRSLKPKHLIDSPGLRYQLETIDNCLTMLSKWETTQTP